MSDQESCVICRFWQPSWKFKREQKLQEADAAPGRVGSRHAHANLQNADRGLCRRYAPQASPLATKWMETISSDWCGDYEPGSQTESQERPEQNASERVGFQVRS
jgi:hypothetical protein